MNKRQSRLQSFCAKMTISRGVMLGLTMVLISGCAVGPDYQRPAAPGVQRYTATAMSSTLAAGQGEAKQTLAIGANISASWWMLYQSKHLDQVLNQAIDNNPDLAAARATLAQAQQTLLQARGSYYPQLDVNASARRQSSNNISSNTAYTNLYSVGASINYNIDLFGGNRRRVEQESALLAYQHYQLAAAYLTLTGNAVTQAITIASIRQQISTVNDIIKDDEHNLKLVKLKYRAGKAARSDVLSAESQLANDQVQLPSLKQQLNVAQHALSVLVGKFPAQWPAPEFKLDEFSLPATIPLSVPSALVRQRPDILAAESQLHADSAAIGVAASQLYPNIQLSSTLGVQSLTTANLFQSTNKFWSLVASLTAPIFHGGELAAQKQAAIYAFRASAAKYQKTVLSAFAQVADQLRALAHDAELVDAQKNAMETSLASLKLQRLSYEAGKADLLQLLDAERAYQQARLGYARALTQRFQDSAKLFVAMGGGWWQVRDLADMPPKAHSGMQPVDDRQTTGMH
ncbi:MAG: efflux transporter outer membrane subunit [Gammaproteobacteria bacterium]